MTKRSVVVSGLGGLLLLGMIPGAPMALSATNPSSLWHQAEACDRRLMASERSMRLRSSWERCIRRYAGVVEAAPESPQGLRALQRQAELTQALSRRSGKRRDKETADALFLRYRTLTADDTRPQPTRPRKDRSDKLTSAAGRSPAPSTDPFRIVIDPGHGGKDPGAIGVGGLEEKEVVLDVAKRVDAILAKHPRLNVILTRSDDRFISLENRTTLATERQADLFISIHANSSPRRDTQGLETYVLGRSTDEDARTTAERENTASGETGTQNLDAVIQTMLDDLSDSTREEHSLELAHTVTQSVLRGVGKRYRVTDLGIKRAPFYVLLNTDMPSILSELAFLSNPADAARLAQTAFRQHLAEGLAAGILDYVSSPVLTRLD